MTELERGEGGYLSQKPLESHGYSSTVLLPGKTVQVYKETCSRKSGVYGLPDGLINTSANMSAPLQKVVRGVPNSYLKKFKKCRHLKQETRVSFEIILQEVYGKKYNKLTHFI